MSSAVNRLPDSASRFERENAALYAAAAGKRRKNFEEAMETLSPRQAILQNRVNYLNEEIASGQVEKARRLNGARAKGVNSLA